jgi:hypothetical protein
MFRDASRKNLVFDCNCFVSMWTKDLLLTLHFSSLPLSQALASERPGACYSDCLMHCGFAQNLNTGMAAAANF